jgi:minor extracellular serine protease Vpr
MRIINEVTRAFAYQRMTKSRAARRLLGAFCLFACASQASAAIQILAITSATDFRRTAIAPGSLASVWCTGLTGISGIVSASGPTLPTQLAGIIVYAGGSANAPILAVADLGGYQLINIQVPWDAAGFNAIAVAQGSDKATTNMINTAEWPVFFIDPNGFMIALHATDYSLVTTVNPARIGEWIIGYASNLGPVSNTPPSGVPTPISPLSPLNPAPITTASSTPMYSVVVPQPNRQIGFQTEPAKSNFMGLAPGTVGVYQINFQIPEDAPIGDSIVYMRKDVDCGFFFSQGCGTGQTLTLSNGTKLTIAH